MENPKTLDKITFFLFREHVPYLLVPFFILALLGTFWGAEILFGSLAWYLSPLIVFSVIAATCLFGFFCKWVAIKAESRITQRYLNEEEKFIRKINNGYGDNLNDDGRLERITNNVLDRFKRLRRQIEESEE